MTDGATFSLRLEGIADDEWVLVTVTGGTDIDIDDDNVLDLVPNTVNNFSVHARNGFYDGLIFHRVISGFVIQGGDPNGDGSGGTSILGGSFDDEFDATLSNVAGAISMANSGLNTNSSQFFINVVDNTGLDFDKSSSSSAHAVFGQIVEGTDVMLTISNLPTDGQSRPINDVIIETITIDR